MQLRKTTTVIATDYGAIALDERRGTYSQANPAGAFIMATLSGENRSVEDVVALVVAKFGVPDDAARADVAQYFQLLQRKGLTR